MILPWTVNLVLIVQCPTPMNGILQCPNGAAGTYGDHCTFRCNAGYRLYGAQNGICLADETWSSGLPSCIPQTCPDRISTFDDSFVSPVNLSCTLTYLSQCRTYCPDGYVGVNVTYLCNITSDPTVVDWVPVGGVLQACESGLLLLCIVYLQFSI